MTVKKRLTNLKQLEVELNDIASCKMILTRSIASDSYKTNNTVGAGMIVGVSHRDEDKVQVEDKNYTDAEKALNLYIKDNFVERESKQFNVQRNK